MKSKDNLVNTIDENDKAEIVLSKNLEYHLKMNIAFGLNIPWIDYQGFVQP